MDPSVHEYTLHASAEQLVNVFEPFGVLRSSEACLVVALAGAVAVMVTMARERPGDRAPGIGRGPFALASLLLFAMYCLTWGHVDEVAINLEHPYNLYHYGKFSFSPARMVDGTVEYVYYLLLTPLAFSAKAVVAANFGLGLLIAWGHLWIIASLLRDQKRSTQLALLLLYAAHYPIVSQLSNGFGNGLVSLAFLGAIALHFSGRTALSLALACMLPLLRPDAILYSGALLFTMHFETREPWSWRSLSRWVLPAVALAVYLVLHHAAYGHWGPTPIKFKSLYPTMVGVNDVKELIAAMMSVLSHPTRMIGVLAVIATAFFDDPRIRFVRRLVLPMLLICMFYTLGSQVLADASGDTFERYWLGFEQTLFLVVLMVLTRTAAWLDESGLRFQATLVFGRIVPAAMVLLVARGIVSDGARDPLLRNRADLGYAGQLAAHVLPARLSLATTELNTFGLAVPDREIVDLWGYTEPAIAHARMLSASRVRNNPSWFLTARPDVYFAYPDAVPLDDTEHFLATFFPFSKVANMLGDMARVLDDYDVVVVRHPQRSLFLLVKRSEVPGVVRALQGAGYAGTAERPIDRAKFQAYYDEVPLRQFSF